VGIIGRIIAIVIFILIFQHDPLAVHSVVIMVFCLFIFILFRAGDVQESTEVVESKWMLMETLVEETHEKYCLLTDYSKRGLMSEMFTISTEDFSNAKVPDKLIHLNTQYATRLLSGCIIANYIVQRAPDVLAGRVSLGIFLATVTVFSVYLQDAVVALNDQLVIVIDSFGPVKEFTEYLNLPLELGALRNVNLERRRQTQLKRDGLLASHFSAMSLTPRGGNVEFDVMPIVLSDLNFEYATGAPVLRDVSMSIPQGQMVAVAGPHNSGKNTFMQLLAGTLLPTSGSIFVPSHLRVIHISRDPIFLHASMLHNLALGLPDPNTINKKRAFAILQMLGLQEAVASLKAESVSSEDGSDAGSIDTAHTFMEDELKFMDATQTSWERTLNLSFKVKLHIARALIADPEVMILDRSLQALNEQSAAQILDVLHQHVQERGLCKPPEGQSNRRPRTVFFSTEVASQVAVADCVLGMDPASKSVSMTTKSAPGLLSRFTSKSEIGCLPKSPLNAGRPKQ
jgi:ABC-type multidrug transport system fused ATPase/permease subunit